MNLPPNTQAKPLYQDGLSLTYLFGLANEPHNTYVVFEKRIRAIVYAYTTLIGDICQEKFVENKA